MKAVSSVLGICAVALCLCAQEAYPQGSLSPPGPPAPMMRTLEQIEPRIPITSLPWVITDPGSYYLTTNLVTAAPVHGITVQADHVTIDLRGFALVGAGPFGGNWNAINVPGSQVNLKVLNGTIAKWSGEGVSATFSRNGQLENLRVTEAGRNGLHVGDGWTVLACVAHSNGFYLAGSPGIQANRHSVIKDCTAHLNNGPGIFTGEGSVIVGCSAYSNMAGIVGAPSGCRVSDCEASFNLNYGIVMGAGCSVNGCAAYRNGQIGIDANINSSVIGCAASTNGSDGIRVQYGSTVKDCTAGGNIRDGIGVNDTCHIAGNTCNRNGRAGIYCYGSFARVDGNSVTLNAGAGIDCSLVVGNNNFVVRNSAHGNVPNFNFAVGTMNSSIFVAVQNFVTSPWDNISY